MSADLRIDSVLRRDLVVLMDDCLVILERSGYKDRMRKILFERVESVVVTVRVPWARMLVYGLLIGIPGFALVLGGNAVASVFGVCALLLFAFIEVRYLYDQHTTIRITQRGTSRDFATIVRPGKKRRFLQRLRAGIEATQDRAIRRAEERERDRSQPREPPVD